MNDIERTLSGPGHSGVCLAADGSGSGAPRGDEPGRPGIDLGDMLEMGLESLLMHFRRKPGDHVVAEDRTKPAPSDEARQQETPDSLDVSGDR